MTAPTLEQTCDGNPHVTLGGIYKPPDCRPSEIVSACSSTLLSENEMLLLVPRMLPGQKMCAPESNKYLRNDKCSAVY